MNLQVGEQFYALNDITRLRLNNLINGQLVQEDEQMSSDNELILNIWDLENINIFIVPQKHSYKRNNGSFFPYYNNTKFDLSRYQIFHNDNEANYEDTCFIYALKKGGLNKNKIEMIKPFIKNRNIPVSDLEKICNRVQIKIVLKKDDKDRHLSRRIFGNKFTEEYNRGLIKNHFFLIEQTNITKYAVENYVNIMNEKDCNYIIKK